MQHDPEENSGLDEDDDPIPAKRDPRIFHIKKDEKKDDDGFEEDVFV